MGPRAGGWAAGTGGKKSLVGALVGEAVVSQRPAAGRVGTKGGLCAIMTLG